MGITQTLLLEAFSDLADGLYNGIRFKQSSENRSNTLSNVKQHLFSTTKVFSNIYLYYSIR
jgi:hypothetical protein